MRSWDLIAELAAFLMAHSFLGIQCLHPSCWNAVPLTLLRRCAMVFLLVLAVEFTGLFCLIVSSQRILFCARSLLCCSRGEKYQGTKKILPGLLASTLIISHQEQKLFAKSCWGRCDCGFWLAKAKGFGTSSTRDKCVTDWHRGGPFSGSWCISSALEQEKSEEKKDKR